jgi:hypothetical protein
MLVKLHGKFRFDVVTDSIFFLALRLSCCAVPVASLGLVFARDFITLLTSLAPNRRRG